MGGAGMSATTTIYLARHGQSEMNNQKRVTGQLNVPLSPRGVAQSHALARLLAHAPLTAIYTSTLERAIQTAQPLAQLRGLEPARIAALNEIHMGALQGRWRDGRDAEAAAMWRQWQTDMWRYCAPGAESFAQLHERVGSVLRQICAAHRGQSVVIVAHRGTNRVLLGLLLNLPKEQWPGLRPSNKIVHRIILRGGQAIEHVELALKEAEKKNEIRTTHAAA
jgi:broad specificity phosphatase PhoE